MFSITYSRAILRRQCAPNAGIIKARYIFSPFIQFAISRSGLMLGQHRKCVSRLSNVKVSPHKFIRA